MCLPVDYTVIMRRLCLPPCLLPVNPTLPMQLKASIWSQTNDSTLIPNPPANPSEQSLAGLSDATDGEEQLIAESHPSREHWPAWMPPAVSKLEAYSTSPRWKGAILLWLELEEKLGYPYGQVNKIIFC